MYVFRVLLLSFGLAGKQLINLRYVYVCVGECEAMLSRFGKKCVFICLQRHENNPQKNTQTLNTSTYHIVRYFLQCVYIHILKTCSFFPFNAHSIFPNFWIFLTEK